MARVHRPARVNEYTPSECLPSRSRRIHKDEKAVLHSAAAHDICRDVCTPLLLIAPLALPCFPSHSPFSSFFFPPPSPSLFLFPLSSFFLVLSISLSEFNGGKFSQPKSISCPLRCYRVPFALPAYYVACSRTYTT